MAVTSNSVFGKSGRLLWPVLLRRLLRGSLILAGASGVAAIAAADAGSRGLRPFHPLPVRSGTEQTTVSRITTAAMSGDDVILQRPLIEVRAFNVRALDASAFGDWDNGGHAAELH